MDNTNTTSAAFHREVAAAEAAARTRANALREQYEGLWREGPAAVRAYHQKCESDALAALGADERRRQLDRIARIRSRMESDASARPRMLRSIRTTIPGAGIRGTASGVPEGRSGEDGDHDVSMRRALQASLVDAPLLNSFLSFSEPDSTVPPRPPAPHLSRFSSLLASAVGDGTRPQLALGIGPLASTGSDTTGSSARHSSLTASTGDHTGDQAQEDAELQRAIAASLEVSEPPVRSSAPATASTAILSSDARSPGPHSHSREASEGYNGVAPDSPSGGAGGEAEDDEYYKMLQLAIEESKRTAAGSSGATPPPSTNARGSGAPRVGTSGRDVLSHPSSYLASMPTRTLASSTASSSVSGSRTGISVAVPRTIHTQSNLGPSYTDRHDFTARSQAISGGESASRAPQARVSSSAGTNYPNSRSSGASISASVSGRSLGGGSSSSSRLEPSLRSMLAATRSDAPVPLVNPMGSSRHVASFGGPPPGGRVALHIGPRAPSPLLAPTTRGGTTITSRGSDTTPTRSAGGVVTSAVRGTTYHIREAGRK